MRKLVAVMNMTLDGFCDHTVMIADDEIHRHYTDLIRNSGTLLYGRTTYQLMESYWPEVAKNPTGEKDTDDFALAIQDIPKIVFSRTLKSVGWKNATLAKRDLRDEVMALKQSATEGNKDILVGSPGLIAQLTEMDLFDEYQLGIQPIIAGKGLPLFRNISERIVLKRVKTKNFSGSGAMMVYCEPIRK